MFAAVLGITNVAMSPTLALLYSGLEPAAAGEVVQSLEQAGVGFEIRQGSIYVETSKRDSLRMTLAAQGLPTNTSQGYELLDSLSGFGTTAQMFDAAYWRAKEGELARTIISSPQLKGARVHISNSTGAGFRKSSVPTASVTATTNSGSLSSQQGKALRYLVASAVAGLSPDRVSVIDGRNGIVISNDEALAGAGAHNDRAAELRTSVERMLEARVGPGNAVVQINVETVTEKESIIERSFDPESRVAISTITEESSTSSNDAGSNGVTVASNLPEGDASGGGSNSSSNNTETRETTNFEVSETTRELLRVPGNVRKISVAVLLDGVTVENPETGAAEWSPRSQEELSVLEELVKSAVGFDADRGDTVTLRSLQFDTTTFEGTVAEPSFIQDLALDWMRIIQLGVLSLVTLVLGLFVFRPIFMQSPTLALPEPRVGTLAPNSIPSAVAQQQKLAPLSGEIADYDVPNLPEIGAPNATASSAAALMDGADDPVDRLRQMISERQEETVEVLRSWMEDEGESA